MKIKGEDTRYRCIHPAVLNEMTEADHIRGDLAAKPGSKIPPPKLKVQTAFNIEISYYGIVKNQASWPVNYVPLWIRHCKGYQELK